jgi:hypothetical protein
MATLMAELSRDNILKGFVWVLSRGHGGQFVLQMSITYFHIPLF